MAKMFYTMEETKSALAKSEEEVRQYAREGRLREFRDGPRLMFKADQVEQLKSELADGGGETVNLLPVEEPAVADKDGSVIGLADSSSDKKEDTHFADIGLSGVLGDSAKDPGGSRIGSGLGNLPGSGVGSGAGSGAGARGTGITIFDVDDAEKADPSAQTAINPGLKEQGLESVGSGSGLLDLTRESDDTSLGAVFDELGPGGSVAGRRPTAPSTMAAMETQAGADIGMPALERSARPVQAAPVYIEGPDAVGTALAGASIAATFVVCFGGFIIAATTLGFRPEILNTLRLDDGGSGKIYALAALLATVIFGAVGFVIGNKGAK